MTESLPTVGQFLPIGHLLLARANVNDHYSIVLTLSPGCPAEFYVGKCWAHNHECFEGMFFGSLDKAIASYHDARGA